MKSNKVCIIHNSISGTCREAKDYIAAFEDFLRTFKSSSTETENALEDLRLDEEILGDDYDMMDDAYDNGNGRHWGQQRRGAATRSPKLKYMKMLQDVADRTRSQILINLDDLDAVSSLVILIRSKLRSVWNG